MNSLDNTATNVSAMGSISLASRHSRSTGAGTNTPSNIVQYKAGAEIFRQGSRPTKVYEILHGMVKLCRIEPCGKELIVGLRWQSSFLGTATAIMGLAHITSASAVLPCRLRAMDTDEFRGWLRTHKDFSWRLHHIHSQEIFGYVSHAGSLVGLTARERLENTLWQLVQALDLKPQSPHAPIRMRSPLKQWELAQVVGVCREHLNRLLKQLEKDNLVHRHKGWLLINNPADLWHEAEEGKLF